MSLGPQPERRLLGGTSKSRIALVDVAPSEPTNEEFCELGWSAYAVMPLGSVATWVILDFLFGTVQGVAGAALSGMLGGLAMCAAVRWRGASRRPVAPVRCAVVPP